MFKFGSTKRLGGYRNGVGGGNSLSGAVTKLGSSCSQLTGQVMPNRLANSTWSMRCARATLTRLQSGTTPRLCVTLASGSSYFFQAGTADLVNEWVATCNYWCHHFGEEPLMGGVSNMDYGWALVQSDDGPEGQATVKRLEEIASVS